MPRDERMHASAIISPHRRPPPDPNDEPIHYSTAWRGRRGIATKHMKMAAREYRVNRLPITMWKPLITRHMADASAEWRLVKARRR